MECPDSLVWDNFKKICMEYSTTCDVDDYYDYPDLRPGHHNAAPSKYVEETEQRHTSSLDTDGYQQAVGQPDIITYYPHDDKAEDTFSPDAYIDNDDFKNYHDEESKYGNNVYADEFH